MTLLDISENNFLSGIDLVIFVVENEDFFNYTWNSCNLNRVENFKFLFFKKDELEKNNINWKTNILFKICDLKKNYDTISVVGPNTFFNTTDNLINIIRKISNPLLATKKILSAPLLVTNDYIFNSHIDRKNDLDFLKIFKNFYNNIDKLVYFDFCVFNTVLLRFSPPLIDFYQNRLHNKFDDLFGNLMFNNLAYNDTVPINYQLTHKPFFNITQDISFKLLKDSVYSKVYTFNEKYNPFTNDLPVDLLTLQHVHMLKLINQIECDNKLFNNNMKKIKKLNLIAELI